LYDNKRRIAVIGVGNILMADEGVGIRVLDKLKERGVPEGIDLIDAGTSFFDIAPTLEGYRKIIIIDATRGGKSPGTLYKFRESDINVHNEGAISLHDFGVVESLKLERLIRQISDNIVFIGIEPKNIKPSLELSDTIENVINRVIDLVMAEIIKDSELTV